MIKYLSWFITTGVCLVCIFALSQGANAQVSINPANTQANVTFAFRLHYGVIYAHTKQVANTAGAHPRGFEFEFSKQLTNKKIWEDYRCYPRMGLIVSYFNLNTPILGNSYSAAYFIEPNYRISNSTSFFLRTAAGLSYLTNPHDSIKNPANQSYSLPVNFFLSVGVGINWRLNQYTALSFMTSFQHNSNGGFELPNHGINYPTASLGIKYSPDINILPAYKKEKDETYRRIRPAVDAGIYYSPKSGYNSAWISQHKYLAGMFVQVSRQVSALDALTLSAEFYHDGALESIKKLLGDNTSCNLVGLMVGHEFIFRRIFFSQQLGYYVYKNTQTFSNLYAQSFPALYHRWGLRYKLYPHWYIGFNMLAHKQVADFIDARVSYRF